MKIDKSLRTGSTGMLILRLLEEKEMYGYEMIEALEKRSDNTFTLKAGTLYPLLHSLEQSGWVTSREAEAENGRMRKYYSITPSGMNALSEKRSEWEAFSGAVNLVLGKAEPSPILAYCVNKVKKLPWVTYLFTVTRSKEGTA